MNERMNEGVNIFCRSVSNAINSGHATLLCRTHCGVAMWS